MSDVLNCAGMTARQARAALRARCRAQDALLKASRDKRRANAERLGIIGGQPERPAHYPARQGWQKLTHNGDQATGVLSGFEWRCLATEHPYKLLMFVAVVRRHKCYKWQIQLEGQDLSKATAWLEASDIDKITGAKIHFRNGFTLESRDGIAVAVSRRMTEAEIQAEAVILDVAEAAARLKAEHNPLTAAQRGARAEGGRAKAQLSPDQIKIIVAEFSFIRNKSDRRRGEIVAQRCASGRWTHGEPPRKITRKDLKPITWRYALDTVKGYRATHG
jgi:hypothetical protein